MGIIMNYYGCHMQPEVVAQIDRNSTLDEEKNIYHLEWESNPNSTAWY